MEALWMYDKSFLLLSQSPSLTLHHPLSSANLPHHSPSSANLPHINSPQPISITLLTLSIIHSHQPISLTHSPSLSLSSLFISQSPSFIHSHQSIHSLSQSPSLTLHLSPSANLPHRQSPLNLLHHPLSFSQSSTPSSLTSDRIKSSDCICSALIDSNETGSLCSSTDSSCIRSVLNLDEPCLCCKLRSSLNSQQWKLNVIGFQCKWAWSILFVVDKINFSKHSNNNYFNDMKIF